MKIVQGRGGGATWERQIPVDHGGKKGPENRGGGLLGDEFNCGSPEFLNKSPSGGGGGGAVFRDGSNLRPTWCRDRIDTADENNLQLFL